MLRQILLHNKSGFTLVELIVAMGIMLVGLLGLLQSVNIALEYNLRNQMRNEVVRVAQDAMNDMRSKAFGTASSTTTLVPTALRNISRNYTVKRTVTPTGTGISNKYQVDVKWVYKNVSTTHSVMSVRSNLE